jgi:CheY-like chemotaxis protein
MHGGSVRAESPGKGAGATFTVSLPLQARKHEIGRAAPPTNGSLKLESRSLAGKLVLVVDDEPGTREAVRVLLEAAGAKTILAGSTDTALASFRKRRPDLIVSDIGMRGRDGYDLLRTIRALSPARGGRVPAIALTAYATAEDRDRALDVGFQVHLAKPVEPAKLIAAALAQVRRTTARGGSAKRATRR